MTVVGSDAGSPACLAELIGYRRDRREHCPSRVAKRIQRYRGNCASSLMNLLVSGNGRLFLGSKNRMRAVTNRCGEVRRRNRSAGLGSRAGENTGGRVRRSTGHWQEWAYLSVSTPGQWQHRSEWCHRRCRAHSPQRSIPGASSHSLPCAGTARDAKPVFA